MIFSIRGRIIVRNYNSSSAVVETYDGVGYEVYLAPSTLRALSSSSETETILYISESTSLYGSGGAATLYGFESVVDREIFELLRSMPSTGAKKALEYFEKIKRSPSDFKNAIISRDTAKLATLFGFRKPTAEKFIANIRDKIIEMDFSSASSKIVVKSEPDATGGTVNSRRPRGMERDAGEAEEAEPVEHAGDEFRVSSFAFRVPRPELRVLNSKPEARNPKPEAQASDFTAAMMPSTPMPCFW